MKYRRARQTAWRTIGEETIVLDLAEKRMVGLNETAAFIWQSLETMADASAVAKALSADASPDFGLAEIEIFLEQLVDLGLVRHGEPEEPRPVAVTPPVELEPPQILWQETVEQVAATCAFFPAQNPLCNQVPFS